MLTTWSSNPMWDDCTVDWMQEMESFWKHSANPDCCGTSTWARATPTNIIATNTFIFTTLSTLLLYYELIRLDRVDQLTKNHKVLHFIFPNNCAGVWWLVVLLSKEHCVVWQFLHKSHWFLKTAADSCLGCRIALCDFFTRPPTTSSARHLPPQNVHTTQAGFWCMIILWRGGGVW